MYAPDVICHLFCSLPFAVVSLSVFKERETACIFLSVATYKELIHYISDFKNDFCLFSH